MNINVRKYEKKDFSKVYEFISSNYTKNRCLGAEATFFEYSQYHEYLQKDMLYKNGIWEENNEIVALCFYEMKLGEAFFYNKAGYEFLFPEMIDYASKNLLDNNSKLSIHAFSKQVRLKEELKKKGYTLVEAWPMRYYPYELGELNYQLPSGFHFLNNEIDLKKLNACIYKGFDHGDEVIYNLESLEYMTTSPHYSNKNNVIVVDDATNEYVSFAGVWIEKKNRLAYLEPFCVVPKYRHKGIGKAVISKIYKDTLQQECDMLTGGVSDFYKTIGFIEVYRDEIWEK